MNEIHPAPVKIMLNTQTLPSSLFTILTGGIVPRFVANPNLCKVQMEHKINITVTFLQAMQASRNIYGHQVAHDSLIQRNKCPYYKGKCAPA